MYRELVRWFGLNGTWNTEFPSVVFHTFFDLMAVIWGSRPPYPAFYYCATEYTVSDLLGSGDYQRICQLVNLLAPLRANNTPKKWTLRGQTVNV